MANTYKKMTYEQRCKIEELLAQGKSSREIGNQIGYNHSSIRREILRGEQDHHYHASIAQERCEEKKKSIRNPSIWDKRPELIDVVTKYIKEEHLSPAKISKKLKEEYNVTISKTSLYSAISKMKIPNITKEDLKSEHTKVFSDGHIMIPKWIREELDINDGDILNFHITENEEIVFQKQTKQD